MVDLSTPSIDVQYNYCTIYFNNNYNKLYHSNYIDGWRTQINRKKFFLVMLFFI